MKLPSGKTTKTVAGGLESFQGILDELRSSNFTGYVAVLLQKEEGMSKGQIVIKDGNPALADHEFKGDESIGPEAVKSLTRDGLTADASIEVHSNVDVDIIIDFNTDASVQPSDFNLAERAKEIEEEERRAREEAERREKEAKRREELTGQLNEWRSNGYLVQKLEEAMDKALPEVENAFKAFGQSVEKLMELDKRLGALNTKGFESDVAAIEVKLNDPASIAELDKEIAALQKKIDTRSKKEAELRKKIEAWRNEGYNVDKLENVIETDFSAAWDAFTVFMDELQKLKEYEERLKKLNTIGFEPMVEHIQTNLKNPDALPDLEQQFADLELRIKEAAERKTELQSQIDNWKSEGYDIKRFKNIMKESLETVEQAIMDFDRDLNALKELRERFDNLDRTDIEAEAKTLEPKFNDPDSIQQLTDALQKMVTKLEEIEERKRVSIDQIEEWRNLGYNTVTLEPVLKDGKIDQVESAVKNFQVKVEKLHGYEAVLDGLNLVGFDKEVAAIKEKLLNPEMLAELDNDMKNLKKKIDAAEKKRGELKKRVEGWKKEGYVVESIEPLIDGDLKVAWETFTNMMDQIQTLKGLKDKLAGMEVTGYEAEAEEFKKQLADPANAADLDKSINELDEKLKAEKARRIEIKKQFDEWKKAGFVLEALEAKLLAKVEELEPVFEEFKTNIDKLKEFQGLVKDLKTPTYVDELKGLKEKLKNPTLLSDINSEYNDLSNKVEKENKVREDLRTQMEAWKADGFVIQMLTDKINGNIDEAQKASTDLADAINSLMGYQHKLSDLDLRDFKAEEDTVKKLTNDPGNITQIETIMKQLDSKVQEQATKRGELMAKLEDWRGQGLVVDELDTIKDERYSVLEKSFKKFENDLEKLMELQKKLGGAGVKPGAPAKPPAKEPPAAKADAGAEAAAPPKDAGEGAVEAKKKEEAKPAAEPPAKEEKEAVPKKLFSEFQLNNDFVFDTFVVGTSNRFTHAAALAVAESPADAYNPLFIYGGVGLGKTHLLNSIGNHIIKNNKNASIIYVSSERFTNELINAVRYDKIDEFRDIYRTADVLIIDDIQFLAGKESTQEEFFHTFNTLYNAHKQIVVSSDRPPKEIPKLEERLRSRFEGGLITDIQPPSLETKVIILRREAKKQKIDPPDEVVHFIASKVRTNIRELRGYLTKISAFSSLTKREITMELAEEVLKDLVDADKAEAPEAAAKPEAAAAAPTPEAAGAEAGGGAKATPKMSSIEERLSSLKARLSPILTEKNKGAQQAPAKGAAAGQPPQPQPGAPEVDETPVAEPVVGGAQPPTAPDVAAPGAEEELAKCGNCGAIVPANVPECPECGVSFGGEWFECPECRSVVSSDSMRCDSCGAEFEALDSGAAAAAPPQAPAPAPTPKPAADGGKKKKKKKKKK